MDTKNVLSIGFKVLMGIAAGVGVIMGLNKITESRTPQKPSTNPDNPRPTTEPRREVATREESPMMQNIHAAQEFCGRASLLVNSAVVVAENLQRVFSKDPYACSQYNPPYGNYYNNNYQPMGNGWGRQGDFIIEAPGNPNGYYKGRQYGGM